ncbi:HD-GYP domain-containing protein, partial [Candidatus Latescibacterota bacterium]
FFLHDIGKCFIPSDIIIKSQPLTHEEWKILKLHPSHGYKLLSKFNVNSEIVRTIVMQHHERHNGRGYPFGLKGNEIHIYSKICCLADAFEALTSYRQYRPANKKNMSSFDALLTLKNEMSDEIDPHFFQQFVLLFSKSQTVDT